MEVLLQAARMWSDSNALELLSLIETRPTVAMADYSPPLDCIDWAFPQSGFTHFGNLGVDLTEYGVCIREGDGGFHDVIPIR